MLLLLSLSLLIGVAAVAVAMLDAVVTAAVDGIDAVNSI